MNASAAPSMRPPWWVVVAVMLTAVLEVLDMTIVNVALPHMLGAFGATTDQITWVLTSYLVSSAVVMPLTGYLSARLGRRRLLIGAISGFVTASALCGMAWSLDSMVAFRLLQGVCGATLVPLSQAIMFDAFPPEKRGQAMAIWGLGIIVAPILGPTLGGYLTEGLGWRFVFYINLPVGALALLLISGKFETVAIRRNKTDWPGLILMALAIGSLQFFLDQGQSRDWFSSQLIQLLAFVSIVSFVAFFARGWRKPDNIVDLGLLRDRNFMLACLTILTFGLGMFGSIALLPLLTQSLLGYPANVAGELFIPRGIASGITMLLVGSVLLRVFGARRLIIAGLIIAALGTAAMANYSLTVDPWALIWPGIIQGIGMGLIFVPLSTIAYQGLPASKTDEAAGLYGLMRSLGSSIGIAITSSLLVHQAAEHRVRLAEQLNPYNPHFHAWLSARGIEVTDPNAIPLAADEIQRQAQMMAFVDIFWFLACSFAALLPLALLLRKPPGASAPVMVH